jgi:hypothetical protein
LVILILLFPVWAHAQIVTASYDRTVLSKNPASSTTRNLSQIALFSSFNNSLSDITEETQGSATSVTWEEKIKMNKTGIYFTGHGRFSPELYVSSDTAEKSLSLKLAGSTNNQNLKTNMLNNMVNLGLRLTRRFSVGFKYFSPTYNNKEEYAAKDSSGDDFTFTRQSNNKITGIGGGATYQLSPGWYWGAYYISIKQKIKESVAYTGSIVVPDSTFDGELSQKQYGSGISYLSRSRSKGMRFEIAYSRMEQDPTYKQPCGEEIYSALEFSHRIFTFGLNAKLRKNAYFDSIELLDYLAGSKNFSETFTPAYGGFLSLGSSIGHTIGASALMYKANGEKKLFNQDQKAITTFQSLMVNYAYLF